MKFLSTERIPAFPIQLRENTSTDESAERGVKMEDFNSSRHFVEIDYYLIARKWKKENVLWASLIFHLTNSLAYLQYW